MPEVPIVRRERAKVPGDRYDVRLSGCHRGRLLLCHQCGLIRHLLLVHRLDMGGLVRVVLLGDLGVPEGDLLLSHHRLLPDLSCCIRSSSSMPQILMYSALSPQSCSRLWKSVA